MRTMGWSTSAILLDRGDSRTFPDSRRSGGQWLQVLEHPLAVSDLTRVEDEGADGCGAER